jgi:hypothetical protein
MFSSFFGMRTFLFVMIILDQSDDWSVHDETTTVRTVRK